MIFLPRIEVFVPFDCLFPHVSVLVTIHLSRKGEDLLDCWDYDTNNKGERTNILLRLTLVPGH